MPPDSPDAVVVSYVNTTAEVKALSDYCCTSGNAVEVVNSIPADTEILFCPDMFLGAYVEKQTGRKMHVWDGECHVHAGIRPSDIARTRAALPRPLEGWDIAATGSGDQIDLALTARGAAGDPGEVRYTKTLTTPYDLSRCLFDGLTKNWRYPGWRCFIPPCSSSPTCSAAAPAAR